MSLPTVDQVYFWLFTVICAGGGAYLGTYLEKRVRTWPLTKTFKRFVEQVKQTSEAARSIEARVSDAYWSKQKLWEMKRDATLDMIAAPGETSDSLMQMARMHERRKSDPSFPEYHLLRLTELTEA
jgi:hypothetical protein